METMGPCNKSGKVDWRVPLLALSFWSWEWTLAPLLADNEVFKNHRSRSCHGSYILGMGGLTRVNILPKPTLGKQDISTIDGKPTDTSTEREWSDPPRVKLCPWERASVTHSTGHPLSCRLSNSKLAGQIPLQESRGLCRYWKMGNGH